MDRLTLEDGAARLSRNFATELPYTLRKSQKSEDFIYVALEASHHPLNLVSNRFTTG